MLDVLFGRENCGEGYILDTRIYFRRNKKPEWFENDFVKEFLKEIDGSTVLFEEALKDYMGRGISTEMMSTGCKTLCSIYYDTKGLRFYGSAMGDNCIPFLMRIAREKDVYVFYEHYMDIPSSYFEEGLIRYKGRVLGEYEFEDLYIEWCESVEKMEI